MPDPLRAARFWLREVWGPQWDADRRALLARHYWSYLRHAPVPASHVAPLNAGDKARQQAYSAWYYQRIVDVQSRAAARRGVHLTFRPIGKNVRHVATAVRANVDRRRATFIHARGPATEVAALAARGLSWQPWLWSRQGSPSADAAPDAAEAWRRLFLRPSSMAAGDGGKTMGRAPSLSRAGDLSRSGLARVLKIAAATRYVFSPTDALVARAAAHKRAIGWPEDGTPVLGMHVRRGDAASSNDGVPARSTRQSFAIAAYLEAADVLCRAHGIRHIFLATESPAEIARARDARPQYIFLTLPHDRTLFPDISDHRRFIEEVALAHPERARPLAESAILDLQLFAGCDAFVGAFNSEFSMLAWLLAVGGRSFVVPYISLSWPARRWFAHPFDALLNLRNNCPLELYHW